MDVEPPHLLVVQVEAKLRGGIHISASQPPSCMRVRASHTGSKSVSIDDSESPAW